jgi:hypothetical protein
VQSEIEGGVCLEDLQPGSRLQVSTRNTRYQLLVLIGNLALIPSGKSESACSRENRREICNGVIYTVVDLPPALPYHAPPIGQESRPHARPDRLALSSY